MSAPNDPPPQRATRADPVTRNPAPRRTDAPRVAVLACVVAVVALLTRSARDPVPDASQVASQNARRPAGLNPNTATATELAELPGIGPAKSAAIVAFRERMAQRDADAPVFRSPDDLTGVDGIGPITADRLAPWLHFDE